MKHCQILTPADFLLRGLLKDSVYRHNPKNLEDLKHNTEQTAADNDKNFSKSCKNLVKGVIVSLQNDADIFSIKSNYTFVSHYRCLRKNKNKKIF